MSDPSSIAVIAKTIKNISYISKAKESLSFAKKLYEDYQSEKEQEWWESVVQMYQGRSTEETKDDIEVKLHNLDSRDDVLKVISQSHKSLMDAVDDSVLPALAAITADYLANGKRTDSFFRGVCRMLGDMSYGEYETLKIIISDGLGLIKRQSAGHAPTSIQWWHDTNEQTLVVKLIFPDKVEKTHGEVIESYERVMYLLHHNNLAESPTISGGAAFRMDVRLLSKLSDLLT